MCNLVIVFQYFIVVTPPLVARFIHRSPKVSIRNAFAYFSILKLAFAFADFSANNRPI